MTFPLNPTVNIYKLFSCNFSLTNSEKTKGSAAALPFSHRAHRQFSYSLPVVK